MSSELSFLTASMIVIEDLTFMAFCLFLLLLSLSQLIFARSKLGKIHWFVGGCCTLTLLLIIHFYFMILKIRKTLYYHWLWLIILAADHEARRSVGLLLGLIPPGDCWLSIRGCLEIFEVFAEQKFLSIFSSLGCVCGFRWFSCFRKLLLIDLLFCLVTL